jgi:hypothetical protein
VRRAASRARRLQTRELRRAGDSHCIAHVRIGPNSFVAYDDGCLCATLPVAAEQVSGFLSLAFHRQ